MIKLLDLLKEVSRNASSYKAEAGDAETDWTPAGKKRLLGVKDDKPEPWFDRGRYTQIKRPVADDPFAGEQIQKVAVVKRVVDTGVKYENFLDSIASWDKYGVKDYSTEYEK
jgi:hypothetical protein